MLNKKDMKNLKFTNINYDTLYTIRNASVKIIHCYTESNMVADYIAKLAATGGNETFFSPGNLPLEVKGLIQLNKWQLPMRRRKYEKRNFFIS
ncbi:hypothetical protein RND71_025511 [Anisodus tanguticus]|uniref:Uncharacterized protein n=1 Tax=Anisodus tanguticus TaxID=243964 RepID=A0AAE1RQE0_9SOLA|nr:hypothetical protein RND71_025511 [Anisodus tanguticus]